MLEFPAHHAGAGHDAYRSFDPFTQFSQADVGLLLHFGAEEVVAALQGAGRTAGVGQGSATTGVPLTVQPLFERGFVYTEASRHFSFTAFARFICAHGPVA